MTQDDIIEMANDAELCQSIWINDSDDDMVRTVISFAKLVAAKEREACAKVCYDLMLRENPFERWEGMKWCMDRIKARGEA